MPHNLLDNILTRWIIISGYKPFPLPSFKEIKILFKNFPIHIEPLAVRQLDYSKSLDDTPGVITGEEILFSWDTKFISGKNLLVTFVQTLRSDVDADSANNRIMVPTTIKLID